MSTRWFKRAGWVYVPVGASGVAAYLLAAAFCVNVFWAVDRHSHSASDTLYGVFPYFVCAFLLLDWLGRNTSSRRREEGGRRHPRIERRSVIGPRPLRRDCGGGTKTL